jgi:high-affinity iron transporter
MTAAFFIMLREGLEAALVVGILSAYLAKIGRRDALTRVWLGTAAAIALSVGVAVLVFVTIGELPIAVQENLEGIAALIAVGVVTWMLFWMRRQGRALKGELEHSVQLVLSRGSAAALVGLAFVAVVREGLETAIFMLATATSSIDGSVAVVIGALAGSAVAIAIGWAIFRAGVRINLRRFFTFTGAILIFVAAGLVVFAIHAFTEGGLIPAARPLFDLGGVLSDQGAVGSVLSSLFGYRSAPSALQVIVYVAYLLPVLVLFLFDDRLPRRHQIAQV